MLTKRLEKLVEFGVAKPTEYGVVFAPDWRADLRAQGNQIEMKNRAQAFNLVNENEIISLDAPAKLNRRILGEVVARGLVDELRPAVLSSLMPQMDGFTRRNFSIQQATDSN